MSGEHKDLHCCTFTAADFSFTDSFVELFYMFKARDGHTLLSKHRYVCIPSAL